MNFELNEDQRMLQELVREFSQKEIAPRIGLYEEQHQFPREIMHQLGKIGVLGMAVPPEFGGSRTDYLTFVLALEELAKASATVCVIVSVHGSLFCSSILKFGSDAQKVKYLPAAARGEIIGAFSLTEPGAGSDAMSIKTRAVKSGGEYILNGTKAWVTAGNDAEALIIIAKTKLEDGKDKLSAFIVDKDAPGLKVTKIEEKMGLHSSPTAMISLEDCRVPTENRLGEEGRGAAIALSGLDGSRIGVAAQALGLSQQALELAVGYAQQREAFGKKIAEFQALQFMMADMATLIEAGRLLTYHVADLYDRDRPFTKEAAMAKLFTSEAANKIAYLALQIYGGYGYSKEYPIERIYRDARVLSIYEGTSEIQRLVIARHLLKES